MAWMAVSQEASRARVRWHMRKTWGQWQVERRKCAEVGGPSVETSVRVLHWRVLSTGRYHSLTFISKD